MKISQHLFGLSTCAVALVAAACAAPPLYEPTLSHVEFPVDPQRGEHVQVLVSVRAVAADRDRHLPAGMEARIRLDNGSSERANVDASALELVAGDLTSLPVASLSPADGIDVSPQQTGLLTARFAYPRGESPLDAALHAVDLRWVVREGGRQFAHELTFHRVEPLPTVSDPWFWEPYPRIVLRAEADHFARR